MNLKDKIKILYTKILNERNFDFNPDTYMAIAEALEQREKSLKEKDFEILKASLLATKIEWETKINKVLPPREQGGFRFLADIEPYFNHLLSLLSRWTVELLTPRAKQSTSLPSLNQWFPKEDYLLGLKH